MAARHYTVATIMAMLFSQDLGTRVVKATTQALKNAPAAARTRNLRLRRPLLYPVELQARASLYLLSPALFNSNGLGTGKNKRNGACAPTSGQRK